MSSTMTADLESSMRSLRATTIVLATALVLAVTACDREERTFRETPPSVTPPGIVRLSPNQPGVPSTDVQVVSDYGDNAYAVSEGQRLFAWYNCVGCHSHGGGGMGPPLMDDQWIYGSAPENIFETIVEGRPNGMPSYGGRIPASQIWQIVAYVRSLAALTPSATRSARSEHMMMYPGSRTLEEPAPPRQSTIPPASVMP